MTQITCCGTTCELPSFVDVRGMLAFWLLWELRHGSLNGVQLAERLAYRRGETISPGTLYPALAALASAKLTRKTTQGRESRYELTARGRQELDCAAMYLKLVFADLYRDETKLVQLRRGSA